MEDGSATVMLYRYVVEALEPLNADQKTLFGYYTVN
jgi:hypothetical protein